MYNNNEYHCTGPMSYYHHHHHHHRHRHRHRHCLRRRRRRRRRLQCDICRIRCRGQTADGV